MSALIWGQLLDGACFSPVQHHRLLPGSGYSRVYLFMGNVVQGVYADRSGKTMYTDDMQCLIQVVIRWAEVEEGGLGLALVGSYARAEERPRFLAEFIEP